MAIKIIPFFSSLASEAMKNDIISLLSIDDEQIIAKDQLSKKDLQQKNMDQLFIFVGSGGTENEISELIQKYNISTPIILLSYNLHNSLPAAMETRRFLEESGLKARIVHNTLENMAKLIEKWTRFNKIQKKLRNSVIGIIGDPSYWLVASKVEKTAVKEVWGTEILSIPITELLDLQKNELSENIIKTTNDFVNNSLNKKIEMKQVQEAGMVLEKLTEIYEKNHLNAISVECFTLLQKTSISSCFAFSQLIDKGYIAGCEGDLPSTFSMLLLQYLTNQKPWMANVIHINQQENSIQLAHCTISIDIVENYSITSHFESNKSIGIKGNFKIPQDVTIFKIWGKNLTKYWVTEGEIISNLSISSACRTQIEVTIDEPVKYFLENSLANHHILIFGNHKNTIRQFMEYILDN
ncbi:MAG: fucose isomerase [Candidatus Hodarchaeales archaeon]|jgi:L-fucose isomerase-like protein